MAQTLQAEHQHQAQPGLARIKSPRRPLFFLTSTIIFVISALILLIQFFPMLWALATSLMTPEETTAVPAPLLPAHPTLGSYVEALQGEIGRYYVNSIITASVSMLITMVLATLAAYAFARLHFRWKGIILLVVLFFSLFPPLVQVIPIYQILHSLHLLNTLPGLILPYSVFGLPLAVLILMAFFQDVPMELEEAAIVDGLSRFRAFIQIILPVTVPGLFATAIIVFVGNWNEYLFALNYTSTKTYTLPVGIVTISQTEFTTNFAILSAATVLSVIPLVILIMLLERRVVSGLTAGALKG
ncbi:carbohydrate ABC transporter permease [Dictyobacter aurantiacus]|uniref:Sugar ABC transporter permease n=1 Tax=Dictyobacter aurantiacus TaxID=1936993 RepID=A0A401ZSI2_9CHLR|nr:carbohydrate ABC transporter permease [Dictyobacter aurantiacus]GCE09849.1 sugar ABC transporter permease [Dictyobacter aurantiacus]